MTAMLTESVPVYYKGKFDGYVSEERLMVGFSTYEGTGCYAAGRTEHKMLRANHYETFCICEDCDWEI